MCLVSLQEMLVAQVLVEQEMLAVLAERTLFQPAHLVLMAHISKALILVAEPAAQREAKVLLEAAVEQALRQLQQLTVKLLPSQVVQVVAVEQVPVPMEQLIGMEHFSLTALTSMDLQDQV
jgi:replication-associated recombination protein RarA